MRLARKNTRARTRLDDAHRVKSLLTSRTLALMTRAGDQKKTKISQVIHVTTNKHLPAEGHFFTTETLADNDPKKKTHKRNRFYRVQHSLANHNLPAGAQKPRENA